MGNACGSAHAAAASTPAKPAAARRPPSTPFVYSKVTSSPLRTTVDESPDHADASSCEDDEHPRRARSSGRRNSADATAAEYKLQVQKRRRRRRSVAEDDENDGEEDAAAAAASSSRRRRRAPRRASERPLFEEEEEEDISTLLAAAVAAVELVQLGLHEPLSPQSARVTAKRRPTLPKSVTVPAALEEPPAAAVAAAATPRRRLCRRRANSTSTLFVASTMWVPDERSTLHGIAAALMQRMVSPGSKAARASASAEPAFEPSARQVRRLPVDVAAGLRRRAPTRAAVFAYLSHLHVEAQLSSEVPVMALVLVDRMLERSASLALTPTNWRHVVFGAVLMASKCSDDLSMTNASFGVVSPHNLFRLAEVNRLELAVLRVLDYRVLVDGSTYARAYFMVRDAGAQPAPAAQLSLRSASALELEGNLLASSDAENSCSSSCGGGGGGESRDSLSQGPLRLRRLASMDSGDGEWRSRALAIIS